MISVTRYSIKNERLAPWVKFIWRFAAENAEIHHKLLPTDSIDIVLNLSGGIVYETASGIIAAPPFHANGLRGGHSYIRQTGPIHVWGISFYSFGLFPFIRESIKGFQSEIVDLYSLSTSLGQKLNSAVSSGTVRKIVDRIETELLS